MLFMLRVDVFIENIFKNVKFLGDWILRVFLGIAFIIHGYQKLPIPSVGMMEWYGFSPALASIVPLAELFGGALIIVSGFINGPLGNLCTRLSASVITVYMVVAFSIAHQDWFITTKLFTSEQIFLFGVALYFLLKGKAYKV